MNRNEELIPGYGKGMDISKTIGKVFGAILAVVAVPVALLTQMVFRKDLGERYASLNRRVIAAGVLVIAGVMHAFFPMPSLSGIVQDSFRSVPVLSHPSSTILAAGLLVLFVIACIEHELRLRSRYKTDGRWHSWSLGVNRIPGVGIKLQVLATLLVAAGAFWLRLDYFAIVLAASGVFSGVIDANTKREFYNRVLDTVDAQIESEMVGKAVKERLSPAQAEGLQAHLPAYVSTQARVRIAEALGMNSQDLMINQEPRPQPRTVGSTVMYSNHLLKNPNA